MASTKPTEKQETIDLSTLSLQQLQQFKTEFESELSVFQESLQTLLKCRAKFAASKEAVDQIQPDWENKEILVPLTKSMYVPGVIKKVDNFTIDIGTGYYAEKNLEDTKDYFKRKVDYVQEQVEKIDQIQMQKSRFLGAIHDVMEKKVLSQQSAAGKSSA